MKKLLMISLVAFATILQVNAQREGNRNFSPEQQAERMTERIAEKLELDEEQKKEVHALHLEQAEIRKATMEKRREAMMARREAMMESRKAYQEKLATILTPEQKAKWEAEKKESREIMQERRKRPGNRNTDGNRNRGSNLEGN